MIQRSRTSFVAERKNCTSENPPIFDSNKKKKRKKRKRVEGNKVNNEGSHCT